MPDEVQFEMLPAGHAAAAARKADERVEVIMREFTSSEDGDIFVGRLEGFPAELIGMLPPDARVNPSSVDHILAVVRRDRTATGYVHELVMRAEVRVKRAFEAGAPSVRTTSPRSSGSPSRASMSPTTPGSSS